MTLCLIELQEHGKTLEMHKKLEYYLKRVGGEYVRISYGGPEWLGNLRRLVPFNYKVYKVVDQYGKRSPEYKKYLNHANSYCDADECAEVKAHGGRVQCTPKKAVHCTFSFAGRGDSSSCWQ